MKEICIDCRMVNHSGIGTYIKNVVIGVIGNLRDTHFYLLGRSTELQKILQDICLEKYDVLETNAPIFSIREQIDYYRMVPSQVDLLWVPNFNIPWFYKGKLLVTVHDVFHLAMPDLLGGRYKYWYAKWLLSKVRNKAEKVLTVSEFSKLEIIQRGGILENRITAIPLGVNEQWFFSGYDEAAGRPYSKPYILFVGNVKPNKNVLGLLRAYESIHNHVDFDLVIVGKKEGFLTGDNGVREAYDKISSRVVFTGYVSDLLLRRYYRNALLFVFPSFYEGFGLPLLEAMACGCPVVSSRSASLPEVGGDAVIYADAYDFHDLADKIMSVALNHGLQANLREKGRRRVKAFSWYNCVTSTCAEIENLLE